MKTFDFSKGKRGAIVASAGRKTRITIRLDTEILDWFREQVHIASGGNYQKLINQALHDYIQRQEKEPFEETLRRIIREEIGHENASL